MFSGIYDGDDGDSTGGAWKFTCRHFENIILNTDVPGYMLYITYKLMGWSSDRTFINWFFANSLLFCFLLRRLHGRWDEGHRKMIKMSPHSPPPEEAPWSGWRRPGRRVWRVNWVLGTATTCQKKTTLYLYFYFGISVFVSLLVLEVMPVTLLFISSTVKCWVQNSWLLMQCVCVCVCVWCASYSF